MIIYKETPRLYLREFTPQDLGDLHRICAQPSILKWMPDWDVNFEMRKSWYQWVRDNYKSTNPKEIRIMLAIHHIADDKLIGMVGIGNKEEVDNEVEIAYFISEESTKTLLLLPISCHSMMVFHFHH